MRHLEAHVFDEVPNLQFLYLGSNQLSTIAQGTFRRLARLHLLWDQGTNLNFCFKYSCVLTLRLLLLSLLLSLLLLLLLFVLFLSLLLQVTREEPTCHTHQRHFPRPHAPQNTVSWSIFPTFTTVTLVIHTATVVVFMLYFLHSHYLSYLEQRT